MKRSRIVWIVVLLLIALSPYFFVAAYTRIYRTYSPSSSHSAIFFASGDPSGDTAVSLLVPDSTSSSGFRVRMIVQSGVGLMHKTFWSKDGTLLITSCSENDFSAYDFTAHAYLSGDLAVKRALKKAGGEGTLIFREASSPSTWRLPWPWEVLQFNMMPHPAMQ